MKFYEIMVVLLKKNSSWVVEKFEFIRNIRGEGRKGIGEIWLNGNVKWEKDEVLNEIIWGIEGRSWGID